MTTPTQNLVAAIINGDAQEVQQSFNQAIAAKALEKIEDAKTEVAQNMFNQPAQDSYEPDDSYDDDSYDDSADYED